MNDCEDEFLELISGTENATDVDLDGEDYVEITLTQFAEAFPEVKYPKIGDDWGSGCRVSDLPAKLHISSAGYTEMYLTISFMCDDGTMDFDTDWWTVTVENPDRTKQFFDVKEPEQSSEWWVD